MQSNNSNQDNQEEQPELMSFARRRAMFSQNIADQQSLYNRQPPKRRQSTPCMVPPPEPISRPHVPSPTASIVPPPQTTATSPVSTTPPPEQQAAPKAPETSKPVESPKSEPPKESIPSLSSSIKSPSSSVPLTKTSSNERSQGRVIWVKPDVKPANPLDSRNLKPDQILSNDEAFRIARERRKSDSAVLYAQKMALKQSSSDSIPKVFIPPPTDSPQPQAVPPPQPASPPAPTVTERSVPIIPSPEPAATTPPPAATTPSPAAATPPPAEPPQNDQKPPPSSNISSTDLPKFGSPINEPKTQENNEEKKPNKDEPVKPQAFKNAFKFFQSLGVTPRRLSDEYGTEQKEISDLQQKIDSSHRKRAVTDIH